MYYFGAYSNIIKIYFLLFNFFYEKQNKISDYSEIISTILVIWMIFNINLREKIYRNIFTTKNKLRE